MRYLVAGACVLVLAFAVDAFVSTVHMIADDDVTLMTARYSR